MHQKPSGDRAPRRDLLLRGGKGDEGGKKGGCGGGNWEGRGAPPLILQFKHW